MMTTEVLSGIKARAGDVGIEIEVEGVSALPPPLTQPLIEHWDAHPDGTLRGGFGLEFVSRGPFKLDHRFERKVQDLLLHVKQVKVNEESFNTSIHVHHNMGKSTFIGVLNCATAWWLLENLLVHYCGPDREANMFCLRLADAEAIVPKLTQTLEQFTFERDFNDSYRYAALNFKALKEKGSLEVRSMRGVLDASIICEWAREVNGLFTKAQMFRNPEEIFAFLLRATKQEFVRHFFSETFANKLMNIHNWQGMIDQSAVLVCNFAYAFDWPIYEKRLADYVTTKKSPKKRGLTSVAIDSAAQWALNAGYISTDPIPAEPSFWDESI